jgi:hypothetical protein
MLHFAAGCAAGAFALLIVFLVARFQIPMALPAWFGVFAVIWVAVFFLLRRRMFGVMIGFGVMMYGGYALLAAMGILKWA